MNTDQPTFHYVLIEHHDEGGCGMRSFSTPEARKEATRLLLDGWEDEDADKILEALAENGIAEFEGDPPLQWMTSTEFKVSNGREKYHCEFGIRGIQKGKQGKPATMTVEIHNDLADKLMKAVTGIGPKIYGPVIEWEEDENSESSQPPVE